MAALVLLWLALGAAPLSAAACPRVSMAYYTSWSASYYPSSAIPYAKLTHIAHAFIEERADGSLNIPAGYLDANLIAQAHAAGVKVLVSVGGASWSGAFPALAASPAARANFADQLEAFCRTYGYDGADIDWEFPDDNTKSSNFDMLMQDLRNKFNSSPAPAPSWQITSAVSGDLYYAGFLHLATLKNSMTFFNVMTYDYHGPWTNHSGHNAGLHASSLELAGHGQADQADSINYFLSHGAPASQVVMGLPFYGYQFPTANLYGGCGCAGTTALAYRDIAPLVGAGWTYHFDASAQSPYLTNGSNVITYDDPNSIGIKADWALNTAGVAGVFMWALDQDYQGAGKQTLLDAMSSKAFSCATPTFTVSPTRVVSPTPSPTPVVAATWRVNAGGPAYTDSLGKLWSADSNFSGGTAATGTKAVSGPDPTLFTSERYGASFSYSFAVPPGAYQVSLRFAEIYYTAAGQRLFNVAINGTAVLTAFDIVQAAGGATTPVDRVFDSISPSGGIITLSFSSGSADLPKVSALQIVPQPTPTVTASPTALATLSASPTPVATKSPSPTRTGTATVTVPPTPTRSSTATPSATASLTPTPTRSRSATALATVTVTATATATASTVPSALVSATVTAPLPAGTLTLTAHASATASASPALTQTRTGTPVLEPSFTATLSPASTANLTSSPTATPGPASPTGTPSPTVTASLTATSTPTPGPSSPTSTATVTAMLTRSPTATATRTSLPSVTASSTATPAPTAQPSSTQTPFAPATASATPTGTPTLALPSPSPQEGGPVEIDAAEALPNPAPRAFSFHLQGEVDDVVLRIYTSAMALVEQAHSGPRSKGWAQCPWDPASRGLSAGLYYVTLTPQRRGILGKPALLRTYVLR